MNDDRSFNLACLEKENFTSNEKKRKKIFLENLFEKSWSDEIFSAVRYEGEEYWLFISVYLASNEVEMM